MGVGKIKIKWPSFKELKQMGTYELLTTVLDKIYEQMEENERVGRKDKIGKIYFPIEKLSESPYNIPEFGNFIPFDLGYTYQEDKEIIFAGIDGYFASQEGIELLTKLLLFFITYKCPLPGLFFFLHLLHLNNENRFSYDVVIIMFFQLFSDHKEIMEAIGDLNGTTEQRDYVLSLFYKLLTNPTFQLKFYFKFFRSDALVFNVIGYSLAITAPDHVEKQKDVWQKVLDLDSPILSIIKPWTIIENIYWNYTCALISIKQIIRGDISISSSMQMDGIRVLIYIKNQFRHVPIVLGSILTEKGSRDKNERVLEIKNTLLG